MMASDLMLLKVNKYLAYYLRFLNGLGFRSLMPVFSFILCSSGIIHPDRARWGFGGDFDKFRVIHCQCTLC